MRLLCLEPLLYPLAQCGTTHPTDAIDQSRRFLGMARQNDVVIAEHRQAAETETMAASIRVGKAEHDLAGRKQRISDHDGMATRADDDDGRLIQGSINSSAS